MTIYLKDFLKDDSPAAAIARAINALSDGDTLMLGGGKISLSPEGALRKYYCISNNDKGEKAIAFPLIGKKNITVDGEGAALVFSGDILPFAIDGCENVTVKNLSVDYVSPRYAQAKIVEADENRTVLFFDGDETGATLEDGHLCFIRKAEGEKQVSRCPLVLEFDKNGAPSSFQPTYFADSGAQHNGFLSSLTRAVSYKLLGENLIEMRGDIRCVHTVGNYWVATYCDRRYPGILIHRSKNTTLSDIDLYHTTSMGVVGQLSDTVTLERVNAVPRPGSGRVLSVNADATHFVNCRGKLSFKDCTFVHMMDDACNVHGLYLKAPKKTGEHEITATYGHPQHEGINIFLPGDRVRVLCPETLKETAVYTVVHSENPDEQHLRITVKEEVCDLPDGLVAENIDTNPDVHFDGCETGYNRPRGFLLATTGKVLVENCTFYNMYQGINVGCEMKDWYESGASEDVTIRGNHFKNGAYAGGFAISLCPNLVNRENGRDFLGRMVVEDNLFTQNGKRFLLAQNVRELIVRNNRYHRDATLPDHGTHKENGMEIRTVSHAEIEDVVEE